MKEFILNSPQYAERDLTEVTELKLKISQGAAALTLYSSIRVFV
jgi:hypothetical protein